MAQPSVLIDPLVVMCILDHYSRREMKSVDGQKEYKDADALGTLTGGFVNGVLEIRDSFPVPVNCEFDESGDFKLQYGVEFLRRMHKQRQKAGSKDGIVGWYSTRFTATAPELQNFYKDKYCRTDPIHLIIDPDLKGGSLNIHALVTKKVTVMGRELEPLFKPIPFKWKVSDHMTKIALDTMIQNRHYHLGSFIEGLPTAPEKLHLDEFASYTGAARRTNQDRPPFEKAHHHLLQLLAVLKKSLDYVDEVIENPMQRKEDSQIGRELISIIQSVPPIAPETFDKLYNSTVQDILMLNYISRLTTTQVALMEKLHVYIPDQKKAPTIQGETPYSPASQ